MPSGAIPTVDHSSAPLMTIPTVIEKSLAAPSLSDTITSIKKWIVVDMNNDGVFRIAGHHVETGSLLSSEKIAFVDNRGNLASDGVQTFILLGPISWESYVSLFPGAEVNPSPDLRRAFSDGFPEKDRKKWMTSLFNFLQHALNHDSGGRVKEANGAGTDAVRHSVELVDSLNASLSVIDQKSDRLRNRKSHGITVVDEDQSISSRALPNEETSDDSSDWPARSRRKTRLAKIGVGVGVQTLPQKSNAATSPINYKEASPLTRWMGCRLDKPLSKAFHAPDDERTSELRPVVIDSDEELEASSRPPRRKLICSRPHPSTSKPSQKVTIGLRSDNRKYRPSVKDATKRGISEDRNSIAATLGSTSSSSEFLSSECVSDFSLRETFAKHRQFETERRDRISSKLDNRHKLITRNGIMDVRDLKRTRSGRLSIPTRDTLHHQKIVFDGGDISVDHGEYGKYYSSMIDD
ncbi:hypothetical protein Aperf_G00000059213 [Anoplocephala perfoliata]